MGRLISIVKQTPFGPVAVLYDYVSQTEVFQGTVEDAKEYAADVGDEIVETITEGAGAIANATLDVVRGLGSAIVDGLDSAYDATRAKLDGREPDVIAGIVVVALTVLTVTYIYHSAKVAGDAF